ncbi:MAG: TlpA family protein disulfide reductase [Fimbriimonadaceae bacterium]|nr:TlpA family protein disulfide reductase [Fimbriimonadaceae bacterium]
MRKYGWLLGLLLVGLLVAPMSADEDGLAVGTTAPQIQLKDLDGQEVKLSDLKGKVVYLDFWATWCPPCRAALPHTQKLSETPAAKEGKLVVLAVNCGEEAARVKSFLKTNKYDFRVPMDPDGKAGDAYKVQGIPAFYLIGKDGKVAWKTVGFDDNTGEEIHQAVEAALKAPAPAN